MVGILPRSGRIVRPLLGLQKRELLESLKGTGLLPLVDPSNSDLRIPRNRVRSHLLPLLAQQSTDLEARLSKIAEQTRALRRRLDKSLARQLGLSVGDSGAELLLSPFRKLPRELRPFALSLLRRQAGAEYPASRQAQRELNRQLDHGGSIGCDCGAGWRWESRQSHLALRLQQPQQAPFAYTLQVPGEVEIPEIGAWVRLTEVDVESWMFTGSPRRAGLVLPLLAGDDVTIRSRRPGDRIRPLGCDFERRLKEVLIDRRIPREKRDAIPLLCLNERIVCVPGVTIADDCRIAKESRVWLVEVRKS